MTILVEEHKNHERVVQFRRTLNMTKAAKRKLDKAYDAAFRVHGNCVQFNIMDLGKMRNEAVARVVDGANMDEAVQVVVQKYRKN